MISPSSAEEETAIQDFCEFIRFETISGDGPVTGVYNRCATWLVEKLHSFGFDNAHILAESKPNKPIVVCSWKGTDESLPCILLNSHYDVVPVITESWTVPCFKGLRRDGKIYGRGAQDMKCVCIQHIHTLKLLKAAGFAPVRSVHISMVPDEEIGGRDGMEVLLTSNWYHSLGSIGLALDEGLASEDDTYSCFYGERLPWWIKVTAQGNTGHASRFIEGTAVEQILQITDKAMKFRRQQKDILHGGVGSGSHAACSHSIALRNLKKIGLGDVTTLNLTVLRAGIQSGGSDVLNVIPPCAEAGFDVRISPHTTPSEISDMFDGWCREVNTSTPQLPSKGGVSWDFYYPPLKDHSTTSTDASINPWWGVFHSALETEIGISVSPAVFPAATDSRFLRAHGVRALGFSPIRRSPILLHEHDEYLSEDVFLEGLKVFIHLISKLGSQGRFEADSI